MPFVRFQFLNGSTQPADSSLHIFDPTIQDIWVDAGGPVPPGTAGSRPWNVPNTGKINMVHGGSPSRIDVAGGAGGGGSTLQLQNDIVAPPGQQLQEAIVALEGPSAAYPNGHGVVWAITDMGNVLTEEFV